MGEKKGNFCFQKSPCRWQGLSWTEWAGQTRCPRPGPGIHAGMRMGSQALSDALAVSPGISPLTIKYIWSPRVTGEATGRLLAWPTGPDSLAVGVAGQSLAKEGSGIALETSWDWEGAGRTVVLPALGTLCPAQRWGSWACPFWTTQGRRSREPIGQG